MFCESVATDVNSTVRQWHSLPTWNPMAQVVVLLTQTYADDDELQPAVVSVLGQLLEHGMLNVNVIAAPADLDVLQVLTWYPYAPDNRCGRHIGRTVVADECAYRRPPIPAYRPRPKVAKIPGQLHGCALRVSTSVWEPYSFYDASAGRFTRGIEVLLIDTIAGVLRLRPQFALLADNRENRRADRPTEGYVQLANRCVRWVGWVCFFSAV